MNKSRTIIRENRTYCGDKYMTVDLFQYTETGNPTKKRHRKETVTLPKIAKLNEKRSKRYFTALLNANFGPGDIHLTLTYGKDELPKNDIDAHKDAKRFLNRVAYRRKKLGLPPLKYVMVTEFGVKKATGEIVRIHHHIVLNGGIDRDDLELMWNKKRINWNKIEAEKAQGVSTYRDSLRESQIGYANADRLQEGENGFEALARYLMKSPNGKKRWTCSKNLKKPQRATNDNKYSRRKLDKTCTSGEIYTRAWWEKAYPGYTLAGSAETALEITPPDEFNNWIVYAKLRRTEARR